MENRVQLKKDGVSEFLKFIEDDFGTYEGMSEDLKKITELIDKNKELIYVKEDEENEGFSIFKEYTNSKSFSLPTIVFDLESSTKNEDGKGNNSNGTSLSKNRTHKDNWLYYIVASCLICLFIGNNINLNFSKSKASGIDKKNQTVITEYDLKVDDYYNTSEKLRLKLLEIEEKNKELKILLIEEKTIRNRQEDLYKAIFKKNN